MLALMPQQSTRTVKLGQFVRTFEKLEKAHLKLDIEARTIEFPFSSELPVERWYGNEILSHDTGAPDLSRFNGGANVLFNHDWNALMGVIEKSWVGSDKRGYVKVRFSKNPQADQLFKDVQDEIVKNVSFGYQIQEMKRDAVATGALDTYIATKWQPYEVSFVTVPADPSVGVGRDMPVQVTQVIGEPGQKLIEKLEKTEPVVEPVQEIKVVTEKQTKGVVMTPEEQAAKDKQIADDARKGERERASAIRALCEKMKLDAEFTRTLVDGDKTLEEARAAVLEKISDRQQPISGKADPIVGLTPKDIRNFRFLNIVRALMDPTNRRLQEQAAFEREVSEAGQKAAGRKDKGGFFIPTDILRHGRGTLKRDLTVGTDADGGFSVATELVGFIELLRKKMVVQRAGATVLNGLQGDLAIPKQTGGATAYWVAENNAPTESKQAFGQVTMDPKGLGAFTDISRKLILQSSIDVENLVRSDLAKVVALAVDLAALYGSGASNQPTGLNGLSPNSVNFAADAPTFAEVVQMETEIASDDADVDSMAYIVSAVGRGGMKTTAKFSNTGMPIWEPNNTVNGYNAFVTNQLTAGDFWFGNWADMLIGFWSGIDILVDPYTGGTAGTVRVIALQDVDVAVRHAESFCKGANNP